jgi:tetratricopeptide (TPR) repeat protein
LTNYQKALEMEEQVWGPEHPQTAATLYNLARFYHVQSDYARAIPRYQRALKIWETSYGLDHPLTVSCRQDLAVAERAWKEKGGK